MIKTFSPIFIVGASRSGTTMMNRILGSHEDVLALNELHFIGDAWDIFKPMKELSIEKSEAAKLIMNVRRGLWDGGVSQEEVNAAKEIISRHSHWTYRDIYQEVLLEEAKENILFITDQTPRNIFFIDKILEFFPHAKIIHMVRDPRAILYSQRNRWKKSGWDLLKFHSRFLLVVFLIITLIHFQNYGRKLP